ncbi:MAG: VWA domain-containing protein [Acidobacteria bacterium]|nr:VWA domain-containing protein [Acidobacteriota bacterium]MCI0621068.1 VWA domain-containing protein [Acidobacteriota bacterium]MCI0718227.1 VWA domain-containing protein [Acidobacteriota bacterium]
MNVSLPNVSLSLLLFFPLTLLLFGQSATKKNDDYKLTVSVDLVGVLATVTTGEGALVSGLKSEDFHIYENGQLQEIVVFAKEADQPLRLCLLFDSSASIASELKTQQDAAIEFLQSIFRPRIDRVSILQFSDEVEQLQKFGSRLELLNRAIQSIKPGGGTSLYDAVSLASESLSTQAGRRVIVVVSDGEDTTSHVSLHECLRTAQNSEAVLYALVVQPIKGEVGRNLAGEHTMIFLANRTGGRFFKVSSAESLRASYVSISDELRTQYYLGYYSKQKPKGGEFRRIEVRVSEPNYTIRAREGYYPRK